MKHKMGLVLALFLLMAISLVCGRYGASLQAILQAVGTPQNTTLHQVIWNIRIPRILIVCLSGGALAVSGLLYQTIFKNPLASGDVIGASSGCSLGAVVMILCTQNVLLIEAGAFFGGFLVVGIAIWLGTRGSGNRILNLVIAGIIMQAAATSCMMLLKIQADPQHELANIEYWLMGGFSDVSWQQVGISMVMILISMIGLYLLRWQIQLLSFGEEAETLGVAAKYIRVLALALSTLLISTVISIAGVVSWVGLLVPHMLRLYHPISVSRSMSSMFLVGAVFLLLCDTLARSLFVIELPISIVTSLFGAGFLVYLYLKGRITL